MFLTLYSTYSKNNIGGNNSNRELDYVEKIIIHNNLELFSYYLSFISFLYINDPEINEDYRNISESLNNFKINVLNISSNTINYIWEQLIKMIIEELLKIQHFTEASNKNNYELYDGVLLSCSQHFRSFFTKIQCYTIQTELTYFLNYSISLLFATINKKIIVIILYKYITLLTLYYYSL